MRTEFSCVPPCCTCQAVCPNQCPKMSKVIKGSLLGAHMWLCATKVQAARELKHAAEGKWPNLRPTLHTSHFTYLHIVDAHMRLSLHIYSLSFMSAMSFPTTSHQRSRIYSQHKHVESRESNTVENPVEGPRTRPVRSVLVLANCRVSNQLDPVAFGTPKSQSWMAVV